MTNWYYGIEAAVEAFLLAVITARIPTKAAQIVDHTVSSTLGDIILGTTLSGAIRDGIKSLPKALEVSGKLGGQAFNGMLNLADEGATARDAHVGSAAQGAAQAARSADRAGPRKGHAPLSSRLADPAIQQ